MLNNIHVSGDEYERRVFPASGRYTLKVKAEPLTESLGVYLWDERMNTVSSGRTMKDYQDVFPLLRFVDAYVEQGKTFVDVGTGVSEFAPYLSKLMEGSDDRPIVIDPLDYAVMEQLLNEADRRVAHGEQPFVEQEERIRNMLSWCQIIQDATKVELFNCTLGETVRKYPGILGRADAVVDFYGAVEYAHTEDDNRFSTHSVICEGQREAVIALQRLLLNEGGVLLNSKNIT